MKNDDMKDMQSAMNEAISNGASGAMMQVFQQITFYMPIKMVGKNTFQKWKRIYCRLSGVAILLIPCFAVYLLKFC